MKEFFDSLSVNRIYSVTFGFLGIFGAPFLGLYLFKRAEFHQFDTLKIFVLCASISAPFAVVNGCIVALFATKYLFHEEMQKHLLLSAAGLTASTLYPALLVVHLKHGTLTDWVNRAIILSAVGWGLMMFLALIKYRRDRQNRPQKNPPGEPGGAE